MTLAELKHAVNNPPEGRSLMGVYEDVSAYAEALEAEVEWLTGLVDAHLGALQACADAAENRRLQIEVLTDGIGLLLRGLRDPNEPRGQLASIAQGLLDDARAALAAEKGEGA